MAQFDVHRNTGVTKNIVPYVVIVQSKLFDGYKHRVVVPLRRKETLPTELRKSRSRLNPAFTIEGQDVVLHALDIVSIEAAKLGAYVTSLHDSGYAISDALDELFTRTWG